MPCTCSGLIVAVYRPCTSRKQAVQWPSSGRIQAAADLSISPKCVFNPRKRAWSIAEIGQICPRIFLFHREITLNIQGCCNNRLSLECTDDKIR